MIRACREKSLTPPLEQRQYARTAISTRLPEVCALVLIWVLRLVDKLSVKIAMKLVLRLAKDKIN